MRNVLNTAIVIVDDVAVVVSGVLKVEVNMTVWVSPSLLVATTSSRYITSGRDAVPIAKRSS